MIQNVKQQTNLHLFLLLIFIFLTLFIKKND